MPELSWEEEFNTLVAEFVDSADTRIESLRDALLAVQQTPAEGEALRELKRHFHRLAGTGLTFGFAELSALAAQGEELCTERLRMAQATSHADLSRYATLIEALDKGFAGARSGLQRWRGPTTDGVPEPLDVLIVDDDDVTQKLLVRLLA